MLKEFGAEIWIVDGPVVTATARFHYPTRMAVIRLDTGELVLWSPVSISAQLRSEIDDLGKVRHLIAPNSLHHTFLGEWQSAYPDAQTYAPPGLRKIRPELSFDGDLDAGPIEAWAGEIDIVVVHGNRITTEVVFFHRKSATAIFTDLLQNFPSDWFSGWRAIVARLDLMVAGEPSVPRKFRIGFTDRRAARAALQRVLAWPTEHVLMAHGTPTTTGGKEFLRRAFRWLIDT